MASHDLAADITGVAPDPGELFRLGVVTGVDLTSQPPTLLIGEGELARPMAFLGSVSSYNTGQTVMYLLRPGAPLVVSPLPVRGEDPMSDDYEGDIWHEVGAAGEPAFTNSWANFGGSFETAGFTKQADGWVRLKGVVAGGSSTSATMFTLPEGYRPPFDCWATSIANNVASRVRVTTSGTVSMSVGGSTTWASLSGVVFPTTWNEAAWLVPRVLKPWDYSVTTDDQSPEIFLRDDGWVWTKGILHSESSAPSNVAEMPQETVLRRNSVMLPTFCLVGGLPTNQRIDLRYTGFWVHNNTTVVSTLTAGGLSWFGNRSTPVVNWTAASLASGWSPYASSTLNWKAPSYTKDHFGVVHLSGIGTSANANPTTAFTLPAGYRPARDEVFACVAGDNLGGRVDVQSGGPVRRVAGATGFCSFDGISFRAAA